MTDEPKPLIADTIRTIRVRLSLEELHERIMANGGYTVLPTCEPIPVEFVLSEAKP